MKNKRILLIVISILMINIMLIVSVNATSIFENNKIVNGNFNNGVVNWGVNNGTISVTNNVLSLVGNGANSQPSIYNAISNYVIGHKYYYRFDCSVNNSLCLRIKTNIGGVAVILKESPIQNTWYSLSSISTSVSSSNLLYIYQNYVDAVTANNQILYIKNVYVYDLTEYYGVGNEPTLQQMDNLFNDYNDENLNPNMLVFLDNVSDQFFYMFNSIYMKKYFIYFIAFIMLMLSFFIIRKCIK